MILIGGRAINFWRNDFRESLDYDLVAHPHELEPFETEETKDPGYRRVITESGNYMVEITGHRPSTALIEGTLHEIEVPSLGKACVANMEFLFALKAAVLFRPLEFEVWEKHIKDYLWFRNQRFDVEYSPLAPFIKMRRGEYVGNREDKINLDVPNEEFFDGSQKMVRRVFVHDDLHRATCYYDRPLFEAIKEDKTRAMVSQDLFQEFSSEDQVRLVREEGFAIALERFLIPSDFEMEPEEAFRRSIHRLVTVMTKGWFRDFTVEKWDEVVNLGDYCFVTKFFQALEDGKVRRFGE